MPKFCIPLLTALIISFSASAQNSKTGTWGIANVVMPGDSTHKWGATLETQIRTNGPVFGGFMFYEAMGGVSYDISKHTSVILGAGHVGNYNYQQVSLGPTSNENRIWEQFSTSQYISRVRLEHRVRAEQRWIDGNYRNRFRYRLNTLIPLNSAKIQPKTYFVSVYDEVFFNNAAPNFERNRISATLGYAFTKSIIVQAGWINQYNHVPGQNNDKNNMMLIFNYRINRKITGSH